MSVPIEKIHYTHCRHYVGYLYITDYISAYCAIENVAAVNVTYSYTPRREGLPAICTVVCVCRFCLPSIRHYELNAANGRIVLYIALTNIPAVGVGLQERRGWARDKLQICVRNQYEHNLLEVT